MILQISSLLNECGILLCFLLALLLFYINKKIKIKIFGKYEKFILISAILILPAWSAASSRSFDKLVLEGEELIFGSATKGKYYYPLNNSDYYLGYLHSSNNYFSLEQKVFRVYGTGCSNQHSGLWGIYDKKLFLLDLKPCNENFEISSFDKKVFATWVTGVYIVEFSEKSTNIVCIQRNTYRIKGQKFYYLSIKNGFVEEYKIITNDVIFRNNDLFSNLHFEKYLNDPRLRSVILSCS